MPTLAARFCQDLLTDPYSSLRADQIKLDMFRHEIVRLILDNQRVDLAGRGFGGALDGFKTTRAERASTLSRKMEETVLCKAKQTVSKIEMIDFDRFES